MALRTLFALALILICCASFVSAGAGLGLPASPARSFELVPGFERTWEFTVHGNSVLYTQIEGELKQYATIDDPAQGTGHRTVSVTLSIPADAVFEPGMHRLYFRVTEAGPGGMLGGRGSARVVLTGFSYSDIPYLTAEMLYPDISVGQESTPRLTLTSFTKQPITNVRLKGVIFEGDGADGEDILTSVPPLDLSLFGSIEPLATVTKDVKIQTQSLTPGTYRFHGEILYDGADPTSVGQGFQVGTFDITLTEHTMNAYRGKINKMKFYLKSEWNQKLLDVETIARIDDLEIDEEAPRRDIEAFSEGLFQFYFEVPEDATLGEHEGHLMVTVDQQGLEESVSLPFTITILDPAEDPEGASKQVVEERPGFSLALTPLTGLYLIVFILVVVNLFLILRQRKK